MSLGLLWREKWNLDSVRSWGNADRAVWVSVVGGEMRLTRSVVGGVRGSGGGF